MFPAFQILGAGFQIAGGILQRNAITAATEEKMRHMRLQAAQRIGQTTAAVGGSGVELTSSTVQNHLNAMKFEFDRAIREFGNQGQAAADSSIISALGSAMGSTMKGFSDFSAEQNALGSPPVDRYAFMDEGASKLNDTLDWRWDK